MSLAWMPLLFPFVYVIARSRIEASAVALAYYLGATWPLITGVRQYFGDHFTPLLAASLLALGTLAGSLPWIVLYHRRWKVFSALASLVMLATPPLSFFTVAYPIMAAGRWFPGFAWLGLLLPAIALLASHRFGLVRPVVAFATIAIAAQLIYRPPARDPTVVVVNTTFGGSPSGEQEAPELFAHAQFIQNVALAHPNSTVVFPEGAIPMWSKATDELWQERLNAMAAQNTTLLLGTSIPISNRQANYNVLIARGAGQHFGYVERVPVPFAMWMPGNRSAGYPLQLSAPPTTLVRGKRAAVLICYEQLLAWPALQSLAHHPVMLIAPSNDYWAATTRIPFIQHEAAQDWADLWGIPLYEARNE